MKKSALIIISTIIITVITAFAKSRMIRVSSGKENGDNYGISFTAALHDSISKIVSEYPGQIGVALILNNTDSITVNNRNIYPMMSVFKLHQALAVCKKFEIRGLTLDTLMTIRRDELDAGTWSPMIKEHTDSVFTLSVRDLLKYTLTMSDNNASNLMFGKLVDTSATDSYIATLIPRQSFRISHTESEMSADHLKSYSNSTSPLGAAILINRLFNDSLVSNENQQFITRTLQECKTGNDRIAAPLLKEPGVMIAHKTGSGYTTAEGVLMAHNDVAYITLSDGTSYSLAVFVKDFKGNESEAAAAIAHISQTVYSAIKCHKR